MAQLTTVLANINQPTLMEQDLACFWGWCVLRHRVRSKGKKGIHSGYWLSNTRAKSFNRRHHPTLNKMGKLDVKWNISSAYSSISIFFLACKCAAIRSWQMWCWQQSSVCDVTTEDLKVCFLWLADGCWKYQFKHCKCFITLWKLNLLCFGHWPKTNIVLFSVHLLTLNTNVLLRLEK